MSSCNKKLGFTLTEIIVVVVILGVIATMGTRYYKQTVEQAHERDAIVNLTAIHAANQVYNARYGQYWPPSNGQTVTDINASRPTGLGLEITEDGLTYICNTGATPGQTFTCFADRTAPAPFFRVRVTQATITTNNPRCINGACP